MRELMKTDINLLLFDKFMHVGRKMRKGRPPGALTPSCEDGSGGSGIELSDSSSNPLKREMILAYLMFRDSGVKQREIAEEICVSPSTVSEMIGKLVQDGYVERRNAPDDRRANLLVLTQEGHSRAQCILQEVTHALGNFFENLEEREKRELIRLLDKMMGEG